MKLKPCPLCGKEVRLTERLSGDGTIIWVTIMHGPTIPCGISFIDIKGETIDKWNKRIHYLPPIPKSLPT